MNNIQIIRPRVTKPMPLIEAQKLYTRFGWVTVGRIIVTSILAAFLGFYYRYWGWFALGAAIDGFFILGMCNYREALENSCHQWVVAKQLEKSQKETS